VQNVESLAHASLIARFGAEWFRRVGTKKSPGSTLLTVTGRWPEPRIVEAPLGRPLGDVLGLTSEAEHSVQGVLLGGYGGGWLSTAEALTMPLTEEAARQLGSSIGAGVVVLLPRDTCPLFEVSRVVRYLQGQGAGQCGPCVHGLEALATAMESLAVQPGALRNGVTDIPVLCGLVEGRGACAHPDGVARFVRTALRVFEDHVSVHLQRGRCHTGRRPVLPLPVAHGRSLR
jgi:NADH:ubiquinone oxidoreductase subunit F (NADH-binding)